MPWDKKKEEHFPTTARSNFMRCQFHLTLKFGPRMCWPCVPSLGQRTIQDLRGRPRFLLEWRGLIEQLIE